MAVPDPMVLTDAQAFEQERLSRAIDATSDPAVLRAICKQLLQAWMTQRAATSWVMRQGLPQGALQPPGGG